MSLITTTTTAISILSQFSFEAIIQLPFLLWNLLVTVLTSAVSQFVFCNRYGFVRWIIWFTVFGLS